MSIKLLAEVILRNDLAKLTTEKERRGSSCCYSKKYGGKVHIVHDPDHEYLNEYGGFRSSARHRHQDYKEFSDVLSPLRGILRKNVGRKWDDVYSEFCQFLDRKSVSGIHIFSHLVGFNNGRGGEVEVNGLYVSIDGNVRDCGGGIVDGFYVHPWTRILCYHEPVRFGGNWRKTELLKALYSGKVKIDGNNYEHINNCWFEVWYEKSYEREFHPIYTQDKEESWYRGRGYELHKGSWGYWHSPHEKYYISRKRTLGRSEIKRVKKYIAEQIEKINGGAKIKDVIV